jgi:hypothetical protein
MWELVQAETSRRTSPLDMDVANALQQMWKVEEGEGPFERGNESVRSKRVEKQEEEREELRKEVKELWDRVRRSMTMRVKHPLVYYLESNKRMPNYRNHSAQI